MDLKRRQPHYLDDWIAGLNLKVLWSTLFMVFTSIGMQRFWFKPLYYVFRVKESFVTRSSVQSYCVPAKFDSHSCDHAIDHARTAPGELIVTTHVREQHLR